MKPYCMIIDDFFPPAILKPFREWLDKAPFVKEEPDGDEDQLMVFDFKEDNLAVGLTLGKVFGCRIRIHGMMARLATEGIKPAYTVHSDADKGSQFNAVIYMTPNSVLPPGNGTVLCRNIETGQETYDGKHNQFGIRNDVYGSAHGWKSIITCEMKENRCFIFPSNQLHYATPVWGGFGTDQTNGRMVLSVFFSLDGLTT